MSLPVVTRERRPHPVAVATVDAQIAMGDRFVVTPCQPGGYFSFEAWMVRSNGSRFGVLGCCYADVIEEMAAAHGARW
jgi:hypothetical protein